MASKAWLHFPSLRCLPNQWRGVCLVTVQTACLSQPFEDITMGFFFFAYLRSSNIKIHIVNDTFNFTHNSVTFYFLIFFYANIASNIFF